LAGGEWGEVVRTALFAMTSIIEAAGDRGSVIVHMNAIGARHLFQQIISADAAIGTYARDQAIKLMSDLSPATPVSAISDANITSPVRCHSSRPNISPVTTKSNHEVQHIANALHNVSSPLDVFQEMLVRPHSAPFDGCHAKDNDFIGGLPARLSDALSSLPRLHIQQLHSRLPVFRDIPLTPDASSRLSEVTSQVHSFLSALCWQLHRPHCSQFQVANDDDERHGSVPGMSWLATDIQPADEEHRLSKPEYVHVWVSPGRWFNMPQVCAAFDVACVRPLSCGTQSLASGRHIPGRGRRQHRVFDFG
jgi:hypothetical protein